MKFMVLPSVVNTGGLQRCHVDPSSIANIVQCLGQPVRLRVNNKLYICVLWPSHNCPRGFLQFQPSVYKRPSDDNSVCKICDVSSSSGELSLTHLEIDLNEIESLTAQCAQSVSVQVVFEKSEDVLKHKNVKGHQKYTLLGQVTNLLRNVYVDTDYTFDLSETSLGKLYGVSYLVIKSWMADKSTTTINSCSCGQIKRTTTINVESLISRDRFEQQQFSNLPLGGLDTQMQMLTELIKFPITHSDKIKELGIDTPKGILLQGPPGCGKTSLVKKVASDCDACLVTINGPDLFGARPGESEENLRKAFKKAHVLSQEGACVLFIDEIDALCAKKGKTGGAHERRLVGQLLTLMDSLHYEESFIVIGATNQAGSLDPALRRPGRFDREVFIGMPSLEARCDILRAVTTKLPLGDYVNLLRLAEMTPGYVGADLASLCQEAAYHQMKQKAEMITMSDFRSALAQVTPSSQRGSDIIVDCSPVDWDDIGGLTDIKAQIRQAVEWPLKHSDAFARLGVRPPSGVLLYGPPGCCKTTLVRAAATSCHVTFLAVSGAQLFSPYVGDSEKILTEAFRQARAGAPSILFIDEIDSIVGKREASSKGQEVQERVLSTLLSEMDGVGIRVDSLQQHSSHKLAEGDKLPGLEDTTRSNVDNKGVLVVAATNRQDMLDDALLRPGRFDRVIFVPPPDVQGRLDILNVYTKHMPLQAVDLQSLADKTQLHSGADLENLCREAALHAMTVDGLQVQTLKMEHFEHVLQSLKPSLTREQLRQYQKDEPSICLIAAQSLTDHQYAWNPHPAQSGFGEDCTDCNVIVLPNIITQHVMHCEDFLHVMDSNKTVILSVLITGVLLDLILALHQLTESYCMDSHGICHSY